jgi:hypothetical protein
MEHMKTNSPAVLSILTLLGLAGCGGKPEDFLTGFTESEGKFTEDPWVLRSWIIAGERRLG